MSENALRAAIAANRTLWAAGAFDALSAKLAEQAGFRALMTTGFGVSASTLGAPDVELYTMTENRDVIRNVCAAVDIPVIADADTGYGNALNAMRTVREFEAAGVAGMILEDQDAPKRCPAAAASVQILPLDESAAKIKAAVAARRNPETVIIARTDAPSVDEAIARARAYVEAGADLVQPISKTFTNFEDLQRLRAAAGVPLSLQVLGWLETDLTSAQIEEVAGLAVFPLVALVSATRAMQENLAQLAATHSTQGLPRSVTSMAEFKQLIGFEEAERLQSQFLVRELKDFQLPD